MKKIFLNIYRFVLHFIFPNLCVYCGQEIHGSGNLFCSVCWQSVWECENIECPFCGVRLESPVCVCAEFRETGLSGIVWAWYYTEPIRSMIHEVKYGGRIRFGRSLGRRLGQKIKSILPPGIDMIIPIPVHAARRRERGYNQAEILAQGMSVEMGIPLETTCLKRTRGGSSQTTFNREVRRQNIRDHFAVYSGKKKALTGKTVLLVDDVMTTGATLGECCHILLQAGAARVMAAAAARALEHDPEDEVT